MTSCKRNDRSTRLAARLEAARKRVNPNWKDWGISRRERNREALSGAQAEDGREGKAHCVAKVMNDIKVSMKLVAQWCALPPSARPGAHARTHDGSFLAFRGQY